MGRLCTGACEKFWELSPKAWGYLTKLFLLPMCVLRFVPRTPPKQHQFRERRRLWRPFICTSIHLCPRPKPFWVRGAWSWLCALNTTGVTGITGWYQVPGTRYQALYKYTYESTAPGIKYGRGMCSKYHMRHWDYRLVPGTRYQAPGTRHYIRTRAQHQV